MGAFQSASRVRLVLTLLLLPAAINACKEPETHFSQEETSSDPMERQKDEESAALGLVSSTVVACDVIVAGGSTAALAAALTSAREGIQTCLVEPTEWLGGQLTASGVPAIDYAWHRVGTYDVGAIGKDPANLPKDLNAWMGAIGNPGGCWVSRNCFEPKNLLSQHIDPSLRALSTLRVFKNAVVKSVATQGTTPEKRIDSVTIIQRTPRAGVPWGGYDQRLSKDISDWYAPADSARYTKSVITLKSTRTQGPVIIDASEFGDVLALSAAAYMQGVESMDGNPKTATPRCGQAFTFPFVMELHPSSVVDNIPSVVADHPSFYSLNGYTWDRVWTYRRVKGTSAVTTGDLSLQNWNPGNDFPFVYLFKSKLETDAERADWQGGLDPAALDKAERHALGWARWYKDNASASFRSRLNLNYGVLGTGHGLSKLPYIRDTRRSIGLDGFVLYLGDLQGPSTALTGKRFIDRIAVGAYNVDVHGMPGCSYPNYSDGTLPFYIPLRALTNASIVNLFVAGKTMAQSFLANAAIRLHPIEYATGIGAGSAASYMIKAALPTTRDAVRQYSAIQTIVRKYAPTEITINGLRYPSATETLEPLPPADRRLFCPDGSRADLQLGYCVGSLDAFGPFTRTMIQNCIAAGGGSPCTETRTFIIDGRAVPIPRWDRNFAQALRGAGVCMKGSSRDVVYADKCVESGALSASGLKEIYGPFEQAAVTQCLALNGGDACYSNRWSYSFYDSIMKSLR